MNQEPTHLPRQWVLSALAVAAVCVLVGAAMTLVGPAMVAAAVAAALGSIAVFALQYRTVAELTADRDGLLEAMDERAEADLVMRAANLDMESRVERRTRSLRDTNDALEREVASRIEIERELEGAREAAETANRAKSAFLAAMSHEIRTPMNGVVGMVELLLAEAHDEQQEERLRIANDASMSLLKVLDDVLDFSKIEAGRLELSLAPIAVRELVEAVAQIMGPAAASNGLRLSTQVADDLPVSLLADPVRVRQILVNLVGNAVKFTGPNVGRGRLVHIRARLADTNQDGDPVVVYQVEDDGVGIAEKLQTELFSPFTQVGGVVTRRTGGTGLGLSISKRLAMLMGGDISLSSALDSGSCFTVTLPHKATMGTTHSHGTDTPDLSGWHIIVVDPFDETVRLASDYLAGTGAQVDSMTVSDDIIGKALDRVREGGKPRRTIIVAGETLAPLGHDAIRTMVHADSALAGTRAVFFARGLNRGQDGGDEHMVLCNVTPLTRSGFLRCVARLAGQPVPTMVPLGLVTGRSPEAPPRDISTQREPVLVAEDSPLGQQVVREQLQLLGLRTIIAADGREALDIWRTRRVSLVLTDCQMPEMDGFALTEAIRDIESSRGLPRTPIVAFTANALTGEEQRCISAGMDGYLAKPAPMASLRDTLARWLPDMDNNKQRPATSQRATEAIAGPVDDRVLRELLGDDEEAIHSLLETFSESAGAHADELMGAWSERDAAGVAASAHKLKSAARSIGARMLADLCSLIESAGNDEDWVSLTTLAPAIKGRLREVDSHLQWRLDTAGHSSG